MRILYWFKNIFMSLRNTRKNAQSVVHVIHYVNQIKCQSAIFTNI